MCSIAVLGDDLISSSLSVGPGAGSISLGLMHPYGASTAMRRQFINGHKSPRQLSISSVVNLRASETLTWSRATRHSSAIRRTLSSISNSQNTLFRQLCFCCGVRTDAELVDVVHHKLEGPTRIWCLRRLALCEIWPASLKVPRPSPSTTKSCSRKALWACIDVFVRFSQTGEVVSPKVTAQGLSTKWAKPTTTARERPFLAPSRSLRNFVARCVPPRSDKIHVVQTIQTLPGSLQLRGRCLSLKRPSCAMCVILNLAHLMHVQTYHEVCMGPSCRVCNQNVCEGLAHHDTHKHRVEVAAMFRIKM